MGIVSSHPHPHLEPEQPANVGFHCPVCDADFSGAKPELYDLVSCPECSAELKVIKTKPTKLAAIDSKPKDKTDATEETKQDKIEKRKGSIVSQADKDKKQPAYLKSVPLPVVPVLNPDGTVRNFGLDENDRPIRPGRNDQQLAADLLNKPTSGPRTIESGAPCGQCGQPLCRYCHPENQARTGVLTGRGQDAYDRIEIPNTPPSTPADTRSPREILGLPRQKLVELLDTEVPTGEIRTEIKTDTTQPKQRVLVSSGPLEIRIGKLKPVIEQAPVRIADLKQLIAEQEKLILSWNRVRMKREVKKYLARLIAEPNSDPALREGERQPENVPSSQELEKFRYDAKKEIKKFEEEKRDLQQQLKYAKSKLPELETRLANWETNPDNYTESFVTYEVETPVLTPFEDVFVLPDFHFDGKLPKGYERILEAPRDPLDFINAYRTMVWQYRDVKDPIRQKRIWRGWNELENEIVFQAIGRELIEPTNELLEAYPEIKKYLAGVHAVSEPNDPEQDDPESKLISKTGGAQIGGGIYGSNAPGAPKTKSFEKYDKNYRRGNDQTGEYGGEKPDNFYGGMDSGDLDEHRGDE